MPHLINEPLRSEAQYRITFDGIACEPHDILARRIVDVLAAFNDGGTTEIRVDAATGSLAVYVMIPADIPPETLDKKAEALRAAWGDRSIAVRLRSGMTSDEVQEHLATVLENIASTNPEPA